MEICREHEESCDGVIAAMVNEKECDLRSPLESDSEVAFWIFR